ncbi:YggT family protein [Corynebacterium sp. CCM 8835]|uniref:YggT family protein n=1 Tax=Corynebacterium antarcticum TaxID=2800405 RepID=A0A9Q4GJZ5_9CORY|nr:YggT family protein [Corynebacterium antarcticum]MCK7641790.1 YggT family protein [Corynebacterium antarcticum]MCK7660114.1 YggT family protein [Corynebacterium antarcticum]MCL0245019.1 YggT family protein [Corynebacterium antarcticum]MCX7491393.1 YggT family protein [Corynebacterium antarcticum]MCX7537412.1 YggT family protein [Corynebacterium antarcticum]
MNPIILLLLLLLRIYSYILVLRIIVEMIHSFSRNFRPPSWFAYVAEPLFVLTDPPVKALRRVIPPLRMGNVALDMSIIVLFLIIWLAALALRLMLS